MKRLLLLLLLMASPLAVFAQTTVTGTVVDANGNAYFPGTVSAQIILASGQPIPPGVPASGSIGPFLTTSGGNFSVSVASPQTWLFTLCGAAVNIGPKGNPNPGQVCFSTGPIPISGGTLSITSQIQAVPPPLLGPGNGGSVAGNAAIKPQSSDNIQ